MKKEKAVTIRIREDLWRRLNLARIDGKIKSIQEAATKGMEKVLKEQRK